MEILCPSDFQHNGFMTTRTLGSHTPSVLSAMSYTFRPKCNDTLFFVILCIKLHFFYYNSIHFASFSNLEIVITSYCIENLSVYLIFELQRSITTHFT